MGAKPPVTDEATYVWFPPMNEPASRESHMGSGGGWLTSVEEV